MRRNFDSFHAFISLFNLTINDCRILTERKMVRGDQISVENHRGDFRCFCVNLGHTFTIAAVIINRSSISQTQCSLGQNSKFYCRQLTATLSIRREKGIEFFSHFSCLRNTLFFVFLLQYSNFNFLHFMRDGDKHVSVGGLINFHAFFFIFSVFFKFGVR